MKLCNKCKETKTFDQFYKDSGLVDGYKSQCKECQKAVKQAWYSKNRDISIERSKVYRQNHPEWALEMSRRNYRQNSWRQQNPEKAKQLAIRTARARRFRKYGITQEQYDTILASQNFVCGACHEAPTFSPVRKGASKYDNFVIDHDHVTGEIRGILCTNCNVAIGMLRDSPDKARKIADYLDRQSPTNSGLEVRLGSINSPLTSVIINQPGDSQA